MKFKFPHWIKCNWGKWGVPIFLHLENTRGVFEKRRICLNSACKKSQGLFFTADLPKIKEYYVATLTKWETNG
jgi:leucyl-tRNA synthetase